jgi:hypothetical protein
MAETPKAPHTAADCDESCSSCPLCYIRTGETVCNKLCPHAEADE